MNQPNWTRGSWMQTFTGRAFYPIDPSPEDVDIVDIAHALSHLCRYNGHVERFYSVAEHCVLLSELVSRDNALWALLHDATEAYVGDMIRPLKQHQPDYVAAEDRVMMAIALRFGIASSGHRVVHPQYRLGSMVGLSMPDEVKDADTRILLDERAALLAAPPQDWAVEGEPFGITIEGWPPIEAERRYLRRFHELTDGAFL